MRKVKLAFWLILLLLLVVVGWQNQTFFLEKKGINIDYLIGSYQGPEIQMALYLLIFFLAGLLISYFSSLSERFVARKTIKKLNDELSRERKRISDLETTIASQQLADSDAGEPVKVSDSSTA